MNISKEQEIKNVINHIEEAVWNGRHNDSKGYIIDLSNTDNKIEISATIEEPVHESFTTEPHFKIGKELGNMEQAISKYIEMKKPYIFNLVEYNNLSKLSEETQKMFIDNLLEIEEKLETLNSKDIGADSVRVKLFKKEIEKERLDKEKQELEKEYTEISERKEQNSKSINNYVEKLKRNNVFFNPINIFNKVFSKHKIEQQNQFYKKEAVRLEKENMKNTELIFDKMFLKNDLNKQIQEVEKEVEKLRKQYDLESKEEIKESDILKEKNMLFKVFRIDIEDEPVKNSEIQIEAESE